MIDLSNTELILTLTSVTPREDRERIETREQVLMSRQVIGLFSKALDDDPITDAECRELYIAVYDQIATMMARAVTIIKSGLSRSEWEDAGRPELGKL